MKKVTYHSRPIIDGNFWRALAVTGRVTIDVLPGSSDLLEAIELVHERTLREYTEYLNLAKEEWGLSPEASRWLSLHISWAITNPRISPILDEHGNFVRYQCDYFYGDTQ